MKRKSGKSSSFLRKCIEDMWWRDEIRESARQALDRRMLADAGEMAA